MDKILTRKLFRTKYFNLNKLSIPVKKYQEGGIAALTPKEKAIYAATFAAPLLQAKQAKGQSRLSSLLDAFGKGLEKLPDTVLAVEKAAAERAKLAATDGFRLLTPAEVKAVGLTEGTVAQMTKDGLKVIQSPSAEEVKQTQAARKVQGILGNIAKDYFELGKPVGPFLSFDMGRIRGTLGKITGSKYAAQYSGLKANIQQATSFISQAISGAAVSEQEADRIKKMIPQVGDTEITFEAKLKTLAGYFDQAEQIAKGNNTNVLSAMKIMEDQGLSKQFTDINLSKEIKIQKKGDVIDVTGN